MNKYVVYQGSVSSKIRVTLITPTFTALTPTSTSSALTLDNMCRQYAHFNQDYTWFTTTATIRQSLIDIGFPADTIINIEGYTSTSPLSYFLDSTHYISLYCMSGIAVYVQDGSYITMASNCAFTLPSVASMSDENLHYLRIPSISDNKFTLLNLSSAIISSDSNVAFWNNGELLTDAYIPIGESGIEGGNGDFTIASQIINSTNLGLTYDHGQIHVYTPESAAKLRTLVNVMWNSSKGMFSGQTTSTLFQSLLAIRVLPLNRSNLSSIISAYQPFYIGDEKFSDLAYCDEFTTAHYTLDCGSIYIAKYYGSYLDYAPYTKIQMYVPFIGMRELDPVDVVGHNVSLKYNIDLSTGSFVAYISAGTRLLYQYNGVMGATLPIYATDYSNVQSGIMQAAVSVAAGVGTMIASQGTLTAPAIVGMASGVVNGLAEAKKGITSMGSLTADSGMQAYGYPFVRIERAQPVITAGRGSLSGYPCGMVKILNTLSGYTEVGEIHLEGVEATEDEYNEIISLLKGGVIL